VGSPTQDNKPQLLTRLVSDQKGPVSQVAPSEGNLLAAIGPKVCFFFLHLFLDISF
jgi:hypothetical protein